MRALALSLAIVAALLAGVTAVLTQQEAIASATEVRSSRAIAAIRGDIVFVSGRKGARGLYLMDSQGKNRRLVLAPSAFGGSNPSWSPDRRRIAFHSYTGDPNSDLNTVRLYDRRRVQLKVEERLCLEDCGNAPAWSPNGRWLAFGYGAAGIALRDMRTGRSRVFLHERENTGGGFVSPSWSPDSSRVAVWSICCDPPSLAWKALNGPLHYDVESVPYIVEPDPQTGFAADWSPDGHWIAITLGGSIWKVRTAGKGATRLASGKDPAWSPDGNWIAFVSTRDGDADIYVTRSDGAGEHRLTNNTWADIEPDW